MLIFIAETSIQEKDYLMHMYAELDMCGMCLDMHYLNSHLLRHHSPTPSFYCNEHIGHDIQYICNTVLIIT